MPFPEEHRADVDAMPAALRAILEAELATGNEIVEVAHGFPAPPVGAAFKLARPVSTRARDADDGLVFTPHDSSIYSGDLTDATGRFHLLDPPLPPAPEPTMDEIRSARNPERRPGPPRPPLPSAPPETSAAPVARAAPEPPASPLRRFERSMAIDYEKWHDGIGYDLSALAECSAGERAAMERMLVERRPRDWRDMEALAALDTPAARAALLAALSDPDAQVRMAVTQYAPHLVPEERRTESLVRALRSSRIWEGLTQALDEAAEFHPPRVVRELFRGAMWREGEAAVHFAALLLYVHGKASSPFEDEKRPFFLRFATPPGSKERENAFRELCERVGADPATSF